MKSVKAEIRGEDDKPAPAPKKKVLKKPPKQESESDAEMVADPPKRVFKDDEKESDSDIEILPVKGKGKAKELPTTKRKRCVSECCLVQSFI
jgi:hypothetical protein